MTEYFRWNHKDKKHFEEGKEPLARVKDIFDIQAVDTEEFVTWKDALIDVRDLRERQESLEESKKNLIQSETLDTITEVSANNFYYVLKKDRITEKRMHDSRYNMAYLVIAAAAQSQESHYRKEGKAHPSLEATLQLSNLEGHVTSLEEK